MTASTIFVPAASAQTPRPPKDGLYLYVCLPGNIQGDTTQGGDGLLVLDVDNNYAFVERIALPFPREGTQGDCKGIDASIQTGLIYPMLIDRAVAIDLETSTVVWQKVYDGGCCDRGVGVAFRRDRLAKRQRFQRVVRDQCDQRRGDRNDQGLAWQTVRTTRSSHRAETRSFSSPDNNVLYLYDTRTHEIDPGDRSRCRVETGQYAVNGNWTRVYSSNNGVLGFQVSDIETGKVLYRVDAPGPHTLQ
jgi:hypothetical protein